MVLKKRGEMQSSSDFELKSGREFVTDGVECAVNAPCQCGHACGCAEGDESDHESIFNQILTFFTVLQVLKLQIDLEK